jgi:hypothetical protein
MNFIMSPIRSCSPLIASGFLGRRGHRRGLGCVDRRRKLYGNIGFRLLDANIQELLRAPRSDEASWCCSLASIEWRGIGRQILDTALPAARSTGSQTGENGGA